MSDRAVFFLAHPEARRRAIANVSAAPDGYKVTVEPPKRSLDQNALLWALLGEIADQVVWHGQKLDADDWKHILSASLKQQRVAPGVSGGFVVLGQKTSRMSKAEFGELLELVHAFGAEQGVEFSVSAESAA